MNLSIYFDWGSGGLPCYSADWSTSGFCSAVDPKLDCCAFALKKQASAMVSLTRSPVIFYGVFGVPYTDPVSHMCLSSVLGARTSVSSSPEATSADALMASAFGSASTSTPLAAYARGCDYSSSTPLAASARGYGHSSRLL